MHTLIKVCKKAQCTVNMKYFSHIDYVFPVFWNRLCIFLIFAYYLKFKLKKLNFLITSDCFCIQCVNSISPSSGWMYFLPETLCSMTTKWKCVCVCVCVCVKSLVKQISLTFNKCSESGKYSYNASLFTHVVMLEPYSKMNYIHYLSQNSTNNNPLL